MIQKMRDIRVSPVVLVAIIVVAGACAAWFLWLGPARREAAAAAAWTTPEAAKARQQKFRPMSQQQYQKLKDAIEAAKKAHPAPVGTTPGSQ